MALRDVFVRITGKEDVSAAAGKAGASLKSLGTQAKSLLENQLVQGIGFAGLVAGLGRAVEAANELEASTRKLEGTSRITGVSLDTLQQIAERGKDKYKLSAQLANDFATELGKLSTKAGDVGKATPGMEAFLNLGASKGLSAAETLKAVQQSILGIDEGTDKLFGKNPSAIYQEFADQIGVAAGKLTDQQKAQALLNEAMDDGGKVQDAYSTYLGTAKGQQEQLTTALQSSSAELGKALTPALLAVLPALQTLAKGLSAFVGGVQLMAVDAAYYFEQIPNTVVLIKGKTLTQLGLLLKSAGDFIPFFGDKVSALGDSLVAEGKRQVKQSEEYTRILLEVRQDAEDEIVGVVKRSGTAQVNEAKQTGGAVTKLTADELAKRKADEEKHAKEMAEARDQWNKASIAQLEGLGKAFGKIQEQQAKDANKNADTLAEALQVKLGEASKQAIDMTSEAMGRLLEQLKGKIPTEKWDQLNEALQKHKTSLADLLPPAEGLAAAAKEAADENKRMAEEAKGSKETMQNLASESGMLARAFVDAASATGLMDERMANVLNSAISLAQSLPGAFAGDPASIASAVTSLANIIVGIGASPLERKREANRQANTIAIERLTREVGNLNLRESGKTFAGIQDAVDAAVQARADARASGKGPGEADEAAKSAFLKSLRAQGIGLEEARGLFKEMFGRDMSMANAGLFFQDLADFQQGLQRTEFGQFGSDFEGQLDALTKGFDILGTDDADDKLREFQKLVGKFSPAMAQALNEDLSTPEGRAAATKNLQALFGKLKTGGLTPQEIGVSGNQFLSLLQSILPLLADADGTRAPSTMSSTTGTTGTPQYSPGLPTNTFGIGAPEIRGSIVPALPTISTTVNGGITVVNNFPNVSESQDVLEAIVASVDEALVRRYDDLTAARGVLSQAVS